MSNTPTELRYASTHEWVRENDDGSVTIGITDHAQQALGDLVFVELPEETTVVAEDTCAVVESVKAASDIYAPLSGDIIKVNDELLDDPEKVNTDPYGDGWLFKLQPDSLEHMKDLMTAEEYDEMVADE